MKIEYFHASKYGNGAMVAEEFRKHMVANGATVNVHHVREAPEQLTAADLYVFSSPGRLGKPVRGMRRFLKKLNLPIGSKYAILTTELAPKPKKGSGTRPTDEWQRVIPIMREILEQKGLVEVAEDKVLVTAMKGPLEADWQKKVDAFAAKIPVLTSHST